MSRWAGQGAGRPGLLPDFQMVEGPLPSRPGAEGQFKFLLVTRGELAGPLCGLRTHPVAWTLWRPLGMVSRRWPPGVSPGQGSRWPPRPCGVPPDSRTSSLWCSDDWSASHPRPGTGRSKWKTNRLRDQSLNKVARRTGLYQGHTGRLAVPSQETPGQMPRHARTNETVTARLRAAGEAAEGGVGSTHRLAQHGVGGAVDAPGEQGAGQGRVQAEVQERVPALAADPDGAAETPGGVRTPPLGGGGGAPRPLPRRFPWQPG